MLLGLRFRWSAVSGILVVFLALAGIAFPQSTGTIRGTVTDTSGAAIPGAPILVHNERTGEDRATTTDSSGIYQVPALPVGSYRVSVKAPGMAATTASNVEVPVGSTVKQDFSLKVAASTETVEVVAAPPVIDASSVSVGSVVNQQTVQEIPLNGRHFVDLALLIPGSVTPPANGFLTAPLRGQGSFSFNSAGAREDSVNFMINGINLSDPSQNQITFQPTIDTVEEFKVDNPTFSAEYGRNSGSIVNIATRAGVQRSGMAKPTNSCAITTSTPAISPTRPFVAGGVLVAESESPFKRNQFGGDGGGALVKDKTFALFEL